VHFSSCLLLHFHKAFALLSAPPYLSYHLHFVEGCRGRRRCSSITLPAERVFHPVINSRWWRMCVCQHRLEEVVVPQPQCLGVCFLLWIVMLVWSCIILIFATSTCQDDYNRRRPLSYRGADVFLLAFLLIVRPATRMFPRRQDTDSNFLY
jgi:hypothetical protein